MRRKKIERARATEHDPEIEAALYIAAESGSDAEKKILHDYLEETRRAYEVSIEDRKRALASRIDLDAIEKDDDGETEADRDISIENDSEFSVGRATYLVLTDEEADAKAREYILDSLWAFNASFIIEHSALPHEAEEMIASHQREKCESANDTIKAMITDLDEFVSDAISADGRGHFINTYDGDEHEERVTCADGEKRTLYVYRIN